MERLKQKVVSSSSRVIASLQQVARHPSFSESSPGPNPGQHHQVSPQVPPPSQRPVLQQLSQLQDGSLYQQHQQPEAASSTSSQAASGTIQHQQQPPAVPCLTSDATAHLTEQEREILLEVFKKEEQFQRETIKQMRCQLASGGQSAAGRSGKVAGQQPKPRHASSRLAADRPGSSAAPQPAPPEGVQRAASACGQLNSSQPATDHQSRPNKQPEQKLCRICRKLILAQEPSHLCSACRQFVCDDCASYSSSHQHWTCSSCRRRATQPGIPADALRELGLNSSAVRRMTLRLNRAELRQAAAIGQPAPAPSDATEPSAGSGGAATSSAPPPPAPLASPQPSPKLPRSPGKATEQPKPATSRKSDQQQQQSTQVRQGSAKRPASQHETPQQQQHRRRPKAAELNQASDSSRARCAAGPATPRSTGLVCHQSSQTMPDGGPTSGCGLDQAQPLAPAEHRPPSDMAWQPAAIRQSQPASRQPQTLVTASSDHSMNSVEEARNPFRRDSRHFSCSSASAMLIPIPPDQIYLRRLSDQSNLMRRSSILAASAQDGLTIQRNRSHSEINAHPTNFFYHQAAAEASHLFAGGRTDYLYQQQQQYLRRMSDQQQYAARAQHQQLLRGSQQTLLQSVVTPYSQKLRYSSEEIHSDSSSDAEGYLLEGEAAMRRHYSGSQSLAAASQQPIPSVSVSEFNSSQQRHHHQQSSQLYREQMHQVNVAVEEAIMKQKRLMQHRNSLMLADGLSQQAAAKCRRGSSSGRLLPRIPDEQSKSLLELPAHMRDSTGHGQAGLQATHLGLPCLSPTIRRASAPEGQNIKIVVDDMDGLKQANAPLLTKQGGQLYERLVLYRDHSLAAEMPNGNAARAFGLHVTGGKIVATDSNLNNARSLDDNNKLQACVSWTLPGGPADKVGLRVGDCIVEWDGKWLVNMTYEQVAEVIESSGNIAELLVSPLQRLEARQSNYVRSQRRLSQQTEQDLRRAHQVMVDGGPLPGRQSQPAKGSSGAPAQQQVPRRLPQIPPANLELSALQSADNYSSLGHLEQTHLLLNGRTNDPMHCLNARHEQQSRSANELNTTTTTATTSRRSNPYSATTSPSNIPNDAANQYCWLPSTTTTPQAAAAAASNGYQRRQFPHQTMQHQATAAASQQQNSDDSYGLIGLQVSVDESMAQLEFSILSAVGVPANPCLEYHVRVRILPESHRFKPCFTHPSSDMNWKETFIFQDFPTQQIRAMSLEIGIWVHEDAARLAVEPAQPICETLIPIKSACEHNTDFWPLRAASSSSNVRRKSLNDLVETPRNDSTSHWMNAGSPQHHLRPSQTRESRGTSSRGSQQMRRDELQMAQRSRERSGSNKNLTGSPRFPNQPRRASDEAMATSNSYRLGTRLSPAQGRRAISVTNVGADGVISRPSSRLGSQGNVMMRKSGETVPTNVSVHNSPGSTNLSSPTSQMSGFGTTPTGRRSSLVGIQSMTGYRSQKNSQSGSTDHEQTSAKSSAIHKRGQHQSGYDTPSRMRQNDASKCHLPALTMREQRVDSPMGSRRESGEQSTPPLERKRSFAMLTLRKLKRTMSLSKTGNDSNPESRRSSSSSNQSTELEEDTGVSRRLIAHQDHVGRLKLALVMTKGQLELEVICAEGLRINWDNVSGIYVQVYLVGGGRSNKRKTRVVQPSETPVFKQLIKYDGSLVDNKSLEVSMWQRQGNLKDKSSIGFTIIRLAELKLDQLQTIWYSLHPMEAAACSSSFEDS